MALSADTVNWPYAGSRPSLRKLVSLLIRSGTATAVAASVARKANAQRKERRCPLVKRANNRIVFRKSPPLVADGPLLPTCVPLVGPLARGQASRPDPPDEPAELWLRSCPHPGRRATSSTAAARSPAVRNRRAGSACTAVVTTVRSPSVRSSPGTGWLRR